MSIVMILENIILWKTDGIMQIVIYTTQLHLQYYHWIEFDFSQGYKNMNLYFKYSWG